MKVGEIQPTALKGTFTEYARRAQTAPTAQITAPENLHDRPQG